MVKDAGDDPDCTHLAELTAEVELRIEPGVELRGGAGVATVTKPGLGLEVGGPAINPVPRKNITEMVLEELAGTPYGGAVVTISVPGGREMAQKTLNARLGLLGGISILGTTGIVKPYSTASWKASVVQAIDVAAYRGVPAVRADHRWPHRAGGHEALCRAAGRGLHPDGRFRGRGPPHAGKAGVPRAIIVGMVGKLAKMAEGQRQTHARQGEVNLDFLAELAAGAGR